MPCQVEYLDEGQRHGDETKHEIRDGQVHDKNVSGRAHGGVPGHHVNHHEVAHWAHDDHESVQRHQNMIPGGANSRLWKKLIVILYDDNNNNIFKILYKISNILFTFLL